MTDDSGTTVVMRHRVDSVGSDRVSFTTTFLSPSWESDRVSRSTLRFLDREMLLARLDAARLQVVEQFGDWDRSSLTRASPEIITLAKRA